MKHLLPFGKVIPLLYNGKLISIKLKLDIKGHKNKTITFKDSFLMLPLSLRELSNSFKIDSPKSYFPYLLNDLNYKGEFPNYEFFTNLSLTEYLNIKNKYSNKIWSFKDEAIKYCELDCISLHQVLTKFSNLIFNEFKVDPLKVLTLPSLAMRIWKTHFMPKNKVYQIHGLNQENIRKSYTGGAVDVYIPENKIQ
jgi:DNA polymerase type B, organellar and viral